MDKKYKRMICLMAGKKKFKYCDDKWFLYILKCKDGSLYTGITKDIERRLKMHNDGKASKYTRARRPLEIVYQESCANRAKALIRECEIKEFSKQRKENLIESYNSLL